MRVTQKMVNGILDQNIGEILDANYPASKMANLLCESYPFDWSDEQFKRIRLKAFRWADDKGILYNHHNF